MTPEQYQLVEELLCAYRMMREAYHHDMHKEDPPANNLQIRVRGMLDELRSNA